MPGDSGRTGRLLVSFHPSQSTAALSTLKNVAGLSLSEVADARDFEAEPSAGWFQKGLTLPELGIMAIDPDLIDPEGLKVAPPPFVLSVRPEYFIRRPKTLRGIAASESIMNAGYANVASARQTWALDALGIQPDSAEGRGVVVALLDTGVQADHPDLQRAVSFFTPESFVPGKRADVDDVGHGTHCAGLIAGALHPQTGPRYGVAPLVRLMVIRVFDQLDRGPEVDVLNAVRWAIARGAQIVSLSAGRDVDLTVLPEDNVLGQELARKGAVLLAAAGNESDRRVPRIEPSCSPGNAIGIPAIGAMNRAGRLWYASNGKAGPEHTQVDLVAPGVAVESADPDGTLTAATGTSVATPIVAGVAAVLKSREPGLSAEGLMAKLKQLARRLPGEPEPGVGAGLVQVVG